MSVFLGWAGERSRQAALTLQACLKRVFNDQRLPSWMSDEDVGLGQPWRDQLRAALGVHKWAIVCLSPECVDKPWLLFEAGAISAGDPGNRVVPYLLFGLQRHALPDPLAQFQAVVANRPGTLRLLQDLNRSLPNGAQLANEQLDKLSKDSLDALQEGLKSAENTELPRMQPWREIFAAQDPSVVFKQQLANATEIWLAGVTLEDTLTTYNGDLAGRVAVRCKLRVLLAKSKCSVLLPAVLRKEAEANPVRVRMAQKKIEIQTSKTALSRIVRSATNPRETVEIKETRYPLAYSLHAIDPHAAHGVLYIKFYPYRVERKPKPILVLHANRDLAYNHFWQELQKLFDGGDDIMSEFIGSTG